MLHGQKIIFVSIVDNDNEAIKNSAMRIWDYHQLIKKFLDTKNCLVGRITFDLMQWKGSNTWVLTSNRKWKRANVGTIHNLDDLHLHIEGPVYVLGGNSLHHQLKDHIDELHLYVLNNNKGSQPWVEFDMKDWKPLEYKNRNVWSYVHLRRIKDADPHGLNEEYLLH